MGIEPGDGPLFCIVSRLTWQKGIDLVVDNLDFIIDNGGSLAVLGSGDAVLEKALQAAVARHPGRVGMVLGYDEPLSHLMQGGADAILVPSRFEPCGLTQLYGLRYGCVPVVGHTGGLADTVIDANGAAVAAKVATGFEFSPVTADGLQGALRRVFKLFADEKAWASIQKAAMKSDVSWSSSARQYANLYQNLLARI
jgi:starch synthase